MRIPLPIKPSIKLTTSSGGRLLCTVLCGLVAACGTDGDIESGTANDPARCDVPEYEDDSEALPLERLRATVTDESGAFVPNVLAQACGMNLCLFGFTDAMGAVLHQRSPAEQMRRVAFKYGDGLRYGQFARLLLGESDVDLQQQATMTLPPVSDGAPFEAGQTMRSEDIELSLDDDTTISFDLLTFPDASSHRFVAAEMPEAVWPDAVPSDQSIGMVVILGPLKTEFCPRAQLSLPNTPGWDSGTAVELLLHITDTANHWGIYGEWAAVSEGVVSDDGERIDTTPEAGLPQLGTWAVRRVD